MFHDIPAPIHERMTHLEAIDTRDRVDGTPRSRRLRQVPPETGRFLALMASLAPSGTVLEIGASAGYSGLWLILACIQRGDRLTTFETSPRKAALARETFSLAAVEAHVNLIRADALHHLTNFNQIAFCFMDAEKDLYRPCYDLVIPNLVPGGLFLADNLISHQEAMEPFRAHVLADPRVDALVVPIGKGVLICRAR
jgi:predicted O-methyltransferase YrrM